MPGTSSAKTRFALLPGHDGDLLARRRKQRRLPPFEHLPPVLESHQHVRQFGNRVQAAVGIENDQIGRIARRFDLAIVGQPGRKPSLPDQVVDEGVLFESGRPVIFVPYIQTGGVNLDRIMVCWDGSRTASRAVADAMPFLKKAKQVEIVIVSNKPAKADELPGVDLGQHLARHGLKVDIKRITSPDNDVPSTILSHAADSSADMIVMGGYGHSRLREFVLGGATRGLLESMTVPVLMSH